MKLYSFEKLDVWQESRQLAKLIYTLTKSYPKEELFTSVSQMRRAAISVCSNITEGVGTETSKDQAKFSNIAFASLMELLNQTILSNDFGFLNYEDYNSVRDKIEHVSKMLSGLRNSQLAKHSEILKNRQKTTSLGSSALNPKP